MNIYTAPVTIYSYFPSYLWLRRVRTSPYACPRTRPQKIAFGGECPTKDIFGGECLQKLASGQYRLSIDFQCNSGRLIGLVHMCQFSQQTWKGPPLLQRSQTRLHLTYRLPSPALNSDGRSRPTKFTTVHHRHARRVLDLFEVSFVRLIDPRTR